MTTINPGFALALIENDDPATSYDLQGVHWGADGAAAFTGSDRVTPVSGYTQLYRNGAAIPLDRSVVMVNFYSGVAAAGGYWIRTYATNPFSAASEWRQTTGALIGPAMGPAGEYIIASDGYGPSWLTMYNAADAEVLTLKKSINAPVVTLGDNGSLFLTSRYSATAWRFDPAGELREIPLPSGSTASPLRCVNGVTMGYVAHGGGRKILIYDPDLTSYEEIDLDLSYPTVNRGLICVGATTWMFVAQLNSVIDGQYPLWYQRIELDGFDASLGDSGIISRPYTPTSQYASLGSNGFFTPGAVPSDGVIGDWTEGGLTERSIYFYDQNGCQPSGVSLDPDVAFNSPYMVMAQPADTGNLRGRAVVTRRGFT